MGDMSAVVEAIEASNKAMEGFTRDYQEQMQIMRDDLKQLRAGAEATEAKANRPRMGGRPSYPQNSGWIDTKTGQEIPLFDAKSSIADTLYPGASAPSIGRFLRGVVLGGLADDARELEDERKSLSISSGPDGGFTVPAILGARWVDLLRARMVLNAAGAQTVPMSSKQLSLAKLTADPAVSWKGENSSITDSGPTLGAITLDAKTVVCLVKLSLELSQDSVNIEQILQQSLTKAMALAIDQAGLVGVTTNAQAGPMAAIGGVFNLTNRSKATNIGAPTSWDYVVDAMYSLQSYNVPLEAIGAFIAHPKVWQTMRKLKTGLSGDKTSLVPPPEVQALPKLFTTSAPFTGGNTCSAIIGDWSNLLFGVRNQIEVRVLQEAFMGSNLQIALLAFARVDFVSQRDEAFATMEGITVS
jgi:HK97 family phage major capsid protein